MKDHTRRKDHKPVHPPKTAGLDTLDRERAASLADEGGSSGAHLERQIERTERIARANQEDEPLSRRRWIFASFVLVLFTGAVAAPPPPAGHEEARGVTAAEWPRGCQRQAPVRGS